jgi:hypothetical protein
MGWWCVKRLWELATLGFEGEDLHAWVARLQSSRAFANIFVVCFKPDIADNPHLLRELCEKLCPQPAYRTAKIFNFKAPRAYLCWRESTWGKFNLTPVVQARLPPMLLKLLRFPVQ